jgi:hypothetical protein
MTSEGESQDESRESHDDIKLIRQYALILLKESQDLRMDVQGEPDHTVKIDQYLSKGFKRAFWRESQDDLSKRRLKALLRTRL